MKFVGTAEDRVTYSFDTSYSVSGRSASVAILSNFALVFPDAFKVKWYPAPPERRLAWDTPRKGGSLRRRVSARGC